MAAYRPVYDSHHLQADCQEPGSAPNPALGNRVWATFFKRCHDPNDHVSGVFISVFEANEHVQAYHEICGVWSVRRQTYGYLPSRIDFIFVSDIVKKLGWPE